MAGCCQLLGGSEFGGGHRLCLGEVVNSNGDEHIQQRVCKLTAKENKKLSYPQRKCASNVAILYGAGGISI